MNKSFLKSSGIITIMIFLSRILGLVRDHLIAKYFGANGLTDAFFVAFKIPNFLRRLFAEGSLSQALVPILSQAKNDGGEEQVQTVINHIGTRLLLILIIITLIAVIFAPVIIFIFAWGFYFDVDQTKFNLASYMLRITFPYLLLISLTAFSGAILNHYNKFAIPAFTPVLLNISIILSAIYLSKYFETSIISLAWGVLIGGILQLAFQIPFLMQIKKIPKLTYSNHPVIKLVKKRMIPAMFGTSISQINLLIDTVIASTLISGSISWLYHSDRLLELPLALIGIALATVALTKLSKYFASKDEEKFTYIVNYAIKIGIILGIPSSVGLLLLSESLIITLFQYGEFNAFDSKQSAKSLLAYSSGLIAFIVVKILASAFLARGDTKTPVKAGIIAMIVNIILNLILVQFLFHVGLALSTSIAAFINATILYYYLHKKSIFKISSNLIKLFFKILIASFIMGMFILFYSQNIDYSSINMLNRAIEIIITIMFSIMIYFIALWILRVKINKL